VVQLSLIAALAATNRMDTVLFFIPALLGVYWRAWVSTGVKAWKPVLLGWSPFFAWSLFALFYYGFLFPNTAYAKLNTRIPTVDMVSQGISYMMNAVRCDGGSMLVIMLGLVVAWFAKERLLALGVVLNLIYVVRVGGDFMSARFYTASLFMCVAMIARYWKPQPLLAVAALAMIAWFGMAVPSPTITSANEKFATEVPVDMGGIADERAYYNLSAGLLNYHRDAIWPASILTAMGRTVRRRGDKVYVFGNIGYFGYTVGPGCHVIDYLALGDALIARLPIQPGPWRVGHYRRDLPEGYVETIETGINKIADPHLWEYYNHLHTVISGDLWSFARLKEIFLFNIGYYDHLLPKKK
jgi:arabinofuranosyltransferase